MPKERTDMKRFKYKPIKTLEDQQYKEEKNNPLTNPLAKK